MQNYVNSILVLATLTTDPLHYERKSQNLISEMRITQSFAD